MIPKLLINAATVLALDHYKILGVSVDASLVEIKKAYRKASLASHPDKNLKRAKEANEELRDLNAAYKILSVPIQRLRYDWDNDIRPLSWVKEYAFNKEWDLTPTCKAYRRSFFSGYRFQDTGYNGVRRYPGETPYPENLRGWINLDKFAMTPVIFELPRKLNYSNSLEFEAKFSEWATKAGEAVEWAIQEDKDMYSSFIYGMTEAIQTIKLMAVTLDIIGRGIKGYESHVFDYIGRILDNLPLDDEALIDFFDMQETTRNHDAMSKVLVWGLKNLPVDDPRMMKLFPLIRYVNTNEMKTAQAQLLSNSAEMKKLILAHLHRYAQGEYACGRLNSYSYAEPRALDFVSPTLVFAPSNRLNLWKNRADAIEKAARLLCRAVWQNYDIYEAMQSLKKVSREESDVILASPLFTRDRIDTFKRVCGSFDVCDRFENVQGRD